ncbi:Josephin-domain-containing protein [Mycena alexandri]|uniref:ubiquitinyl hydrolase 1 n=1 Tax=Mycena alexandri TaxID=1745969 RepID=A0AAD6TGB8_9AGAR|nr:Josephin-domain-containing protein [Mycena alexandri]
MAGLENLEIYHESQEEGSMLCAQHALNSLLQGSYFTAPDLSEIARNLDLLEESYDDANSGARSGNMDDSGFFSVQVLDNALKVWGLNLSRWRGEEMRPFHDHPENQLAFILNYEQHWFTLRRFGPHWYNLNSFSTPEWISKLYLGMVLQQAEADGYSVFAVTPADPSVRGLPHTEADDLASTLPEPHSANRPNLQSFTSHGASGSSVVNRPPVIEGMEDEDYELQAALQASLMGDVSCDAPPLVVRHTVPLPSSGSESPSTSNYATPLDSDVSSDLDPVAQTMERNRLLLERMKAEQEYAQRQLWAAEGDEGVRARDSEEEMIRRALEESEASAHLEGHGRAAESNIAGEMSVEAGMEDLMPTHSSHYGQSTRVYDDDDADLQAALKASLEQLPEGWNLPEQGPSEGSVHVPDMHPAEEAESDVSEPPQDVSVDELRRRRLARFGS